MTPQARRSASASAGRRPGRALAQHARDRLAGRVEQDAGDEPRGDEYLRRGGGGEVAQQVVVFRTDGGAGIAVGDLVGGVRLLVGKLGGVEAVVGDKHPLQAVEDEQPGPGLELARAAARSSSGCLLLPELFERPAGHVGEGAPAEVGHDRALLVEGIPEPARPVAARTRWRGGWSTPR